MSNGVPDRIENVEQLDDMLSTPTPRVVETMKNLHGDLIVLGVGGKMGPTLARMAKRASEEAGVKRRVIGVSRFSSPETRSQLEQHGIETIPCNLLEERELNALPDVENVVYMAGMKFGSTGKEPLTWGMNTLLPGLVSRKFSHSNLIAFSTGNVYGMTSVHRGGSLESAKPNPQGEYAMSCLGRERIFEYCSNEWRMPMAVIRLNYAVEMRYGVIVDLAQKIWQGQPVDLAMGSFNAIWQGDANAMSLAAFDEAATPPFIVNVAGPELLSVRQVSEQLAEIMGKEARFTGQESSDALLSNGQLGHRLFGYPRIGAQQMLHWIADWMQRGGDTLDKPTHFEVRDGNF